jgi:hypothetical protein
VSANENQIGGDHYKNKVIQPWDFIVGNSLGFLEGNAIKYICRYKDKGGIDDLMKAKHYLEKLIEVHQSEINEQISQWVNELDQSVPVLVKPQANPYGLTKDGKPRRKPGRPLGRKDKKKRAKPGAKQRIVLKHVVGEPVL